MKRGRGRERESVAAYADVELVPNLSLAEPRIRIGDLLVQTGVVTREAVEDAADVESGARLGSLLIERGLLGEREVTRALSEQLHVPVVDLRDVRPEESATALLDPADAHRYEMLPLLISDGALTIAVADPLDAGLLDVLRALPVAEVRLALGPPTLLRNRINQTYPALSAVHTDIEAFRISDVLLDAAETTETAVDPNAPI